MPVLADVLLTLAVVVLAGAGLLALVALLQRRLRVTDARPQEDPGLQEHQAVSRAQTRGAGFGP